MTTAKHCDSPAKFSGHAEGMSEALESCLTCCCWVGVKEEVIFDTTWDGDGELVPSVESTQSRTRGASN